MDVDKPELISRRRACSAENATKLPMISSCVIDERAFLTGVTGQFVPVHFRLNAVAHLLCKDGYR